MDDGLIRELIELEPGGVMAYTLLMSRLEECGGDVTRRSEMTLRHLPAALLCALQDENCLQDIMKVGEKYPDLLPYIYGCAIELRHDRKLRSWTEHESTSHRNFIEGIIGRIS